MDSTQHLKYVFIIVVSVSPIRGMEYVKSSIEYAKHYVYQGDLRRAILSGDLEGQRYCLQSAKMGFIDMHELQKAFLLATYRVNKEVLCELSRIPGSHVNIRDKGGNTALMQAVKQDFNWLVHES